MRRQKYARLGRSFATSERIHAQVEGLSDLTPIKLGGVDFGRCLMRRDHIRVVGRLLLA